MPDRSKKRRKNKNKRKQKNTNSAQATRTDAGSEAGGSGDEQSVENCVVNETCVGETSSSDQSNSKPVDTQINQIQSECKQNESAEQNVEQVNSGESVKYIVESPEQLKNYEKTKLSETHKSKSLDDGDVPKITEITEDNEIRSDEVVGLVVVDNALVSEAESDVEWETADALTDELILTESIKAVSTLSINTQTTNVAECEHTQALSPEEELSLRQYLQTLNLVTCPQEVETIEVDKVEPQPAYDSKVEQQKLRKKAVYEEACKPKQRLLEVIDEEGSTVSSLDSRRQSYLKDDFDDLEDDVFHEKNKHVETLEKFPLPKSKGPHNKSHLIPQECLLVGAKMLQQKIDEGCGEWTIQNVAQMKGAELVYLTDSSSSASDIYDIGEEAENVEETDEASVRIITPTIEVNDSRNFTNMSFPDAAIDAKTPKTPRSSPQIIISDEDLPEDDKKAHSEDDKKAHSIQEDESKEIVVLSTENKNPALYVLKIDEQVCEQEQNVTKTTFTLSHETKLDPLGPCLSIKKKESKDESHFTIQEPKTNVDNEINDLKLELNNAISNLMKEVAAEKDNNATKENTLLRQDSSSSVGSSQCTAKYNPTTSSLTDIATLVHDTVDPSKPDVHNNNLIKEHSRLEESHVKDVFERVAGSVQEVQTISRNKTQEPIRLKDLCVQKIASLPYGEKILEELASVSEQLQHINIYGNTEKNFDTMPFYPLPDVSAIKKVVLPTKNYNLPSIKTPPPPVAPRNSSLKFPQDEPSWTGLPTKRDPSLYVCLSPSQKMLMEKTNTIIDKEDANELLDIHQKYVERRGYDEFYSKSTRTKPSEFSNDAIPFKSQTGNRLLAIIRDPGVNVNSKINKWNNYRQNVPHSSSYSNIVREPEPIRPRYSNSARDVRSEMSFKPIPPPRPRKYSSTLYESDESSDFTDHSFQSISERKYFHYSTGNLNKEIEKDVSNIQDMHRKYTTARDNFKEKYLQSPEPVRRPSLPRDLCEQQMEYIRQKEKEVDAEIRRLNIEKSYLYRPERKCPRAPLYSESDVTEESRFDGNNYHISRKRDVAVHSDEKQNGTTKQASSSFKSSQEEIMREKMYSEYMCQMAEREERKQHKVIKITTKPLSNDLKDISSSMPVLQTNEVRTANNRIEQEFITKAKERWDKLGIKDPETEDERERKDEYREPKIVEHKIKVIEGGQEKDVKGLPNHLREFVQFTAKGDKETAADSPGESTEAASFFIVICAVVIVMLAIGKRMIPLFRDN